MNVGLFDTNMVNAFEHVELEIRTILDAKWLPMAAPYRYPDATGSREWVSEQPHAIERSSIRPRDDWSTNIRDGLAYWKSTKPESYDALFGPGLPLENYARSMLGY